ncbi:phosphate ABC transporter substrate-binding protein PstS [Cellulomonas composti]|uniref:Phosphate-binding protein n=1 Tax=Cellulomonas composti TaxID=266130 RepID=A0A511JCL9_9CELL|nr:phosphate ABC transporter substrate-binding protein PstS [Cellulomonas composti]GEL95740.1 phosphate-binding protein PstS [Cellulomonas composti]
MKLSLHGRVGAVALAGVLALTLTACGTDNNTDTPAATEGATDDATVPAATLSGTLNGGGSSAQEKAQQAWIAGFQTANPDSTVNYTTTDSGAGRKGFLDASLDYAGSDSALDDDEFAAAADRCFGGSALDLPVYISPIAVAFNIDGVSELNMSADVVAKVFSGAITTWDDAAITALNPDATLSGPITVVHRSDDSGTSKNFQDYLSKTAPDAWTYEVSNTWPVSVGQGANGTSGVVQTIQAATGTIGYADASAVGSLGKVALGVGDEFNAPTAEGAAATVDASPQTTDRADGDIVISVDRTTTAPGAYPAILVSYLVVCNTYDSQDKADLVKGYASYVASAEGQTSAGTAAGSAPISDELRTAVVAAIDSITTK